MNAENEADEGDESDAKPALSRALLALKPTLVTGVSVCDGIGMGVLTAIETFDYDEPGELPAFTDIPSEETRLETAFTALKHGFDNNLQVFPKTLLMPSGGFCWMPT